MEKPTGSSRRPNVIWVFGDQHRGQALGCAGDPGYTVGFALDRERPWRGVITRDGWKYAVLEGQPWLMYNLNEDPFELANVAMDRRFAAERQKLQDRLAGWTSDTGDAFDLPRI